MSKPSDYQVTGDSKKALFTLKLHRGEGMVLIAMNWRKDKPPADFVGFAIEYKEPDGDKFFTVKNRLCFPKPDGSVDPNARSTKLSPIQKFRWAHFPRNAEKDGAFTYRVSPVFMNDQDELSYGEPQQAEIELRRETYPGQLNVAFTRGFVASQAFVDRYGAESIPTLLPGPKDDPITFEPTHKDAEEALAWMGFEARQAILGLLDEAIQDKKAKVCAAVYDLNEPGMISRFEQLAPRLDIIIDNSGSHEPEDSAESIAAKRLEKKGAKVLRQHMGGLQHNKIVAVDGPKVQAALCGSTNHSWRGFFVQNNNAIIVRGKTAVQLFRAAIENYKTHSDSVSGFGGCPSAIWNKLGLKGIDAQIGFSPRSKKNAVLKAIADDLAGTTSSLFYSLAFLYQTKGAIRDAIVKLRKDKQIFSYGISDRKVPGLPDDSDEIEGVDIQKPDGTVSTVSPSALSAHVPEPFQSEPTGGGGVRMHHKFLVVDFDKPTGRVYMGSYNFSSAADVSNGENLLLIKDRRIATAYMVEAVRIFDHYHFRLAQEDAKTAAKTLALAKPPRTKKEKAWFEPDYTNARRIRDRELFA